MCFLMHSHISEILMRNFVGLMVVAYSAPITYPVYVDHPFVAFISHIPGSDDSDTQSDTVSNNSVLFMTKVSNPMYK